MGENFPLGGAIDTLDARLKNSGVVTSDQKGNPPLLVADEPQFRWKVLETRERPD